MTSKTTRCKGLAALLAVPLMALAQVPSAGAAPIGNVGNHMPNASVLVRRGGGGGRHHGGGGGHHGGGHHGGGGHWGGGGHHGHGGWHGPRGHFYGGGFRRPFIYGVPYYYGPSYYDDFYEYDDDDVAEYSGDAVARCRSRYRSFDASSGTFLSNDGTRKLCPYLR
jgi:hypothetical protein